MTFYAAVVLRSVRSMVKTKSSARLAHSGAPLFANMVRQAIAKKKVCLFAEMA